MSARWRREAAELGDLFSGHIQLRAVIDSVLEGRLGDALVDAESGPTAAILRIGCYWICGGEAQAARSLIAEVSAGRELVIPNDSAESSADWARCIDDVLGSRAAYRPMRAYSGAGLDVARLRERARVDAPLSIRRLDADTARLLDHRLEPHALQVFDDAEHFVRAGVGFGIFARDRLISAATSYAISARALEIAIATDAGHRGVGLAAAIGARLARHALEVGREPMWNAANPVSQRLARRLGFEPVGECAAYIVSPA